MNIGVKINTNNNNNHNNDTSFNRTNHILDHDMTFVTGATSNELRPDEMPWIKERKIQRRKCILKISIGLIFTVIVIIFYLSAQYSDNGISGFIFFGGDNGNMNKDGPGSDGDATSMSDEHNFDTTEAIINHNDYEVILDDYIKEIQCYMIIYKHVITKTEILTLLPKQQEQQEQEETVSQDNNNNYNVKQDSVFGISFRTIPTTSNGVAHILEHSVLSGSIKYPIKDPFEKLQRSSLHTFLNAMTYQDRTIYPVASRNSKDFNNLLNVYLDAVFNPLCITNDGRWILRQEGWRIDDTDNSDEQDNEDNENDNEDNNNYILNGIVMSEMKGVYSNPDELMYEYTKQLLFVDTPYKYDSGGNPLVIPTLSREAFKQFYLKHYHPSNSQIFLYSSDINDVIVSLNDISKYLSEYIIDNNSTSSQQQEIEDAEYEKIANEIRTSTNVIYQEKNFKEPIYEQRSYPIDNNDENNENDVEDDEEDVENNGSLFMISWLINDNEFDDMTIEIAWLVLDHLLVGSSTSILWKTLLESNLGSDIIGYGLDTTYLQHTFQIGMKGITEDNGPDNIENIIMSTLTQIIDTDNEDIQFNSLDIDASINSIEFQLREIGSSNADNDPLGITLMERILSKWNYNIDPRTALIFDDALSNLKLTIKNTGPTIFYDLINKYLLNNNHRVCLTLYPSATLSKETNDKEQLIIDTIQSRHNDYFKELLYESERLKSIQSKPDRQEDIDKLPTLPINELNQYGDEYPIHVTKNVRNSGGITLIEHPLLSGNDNGSGSSGNNGVSSSSSSGSTSGIIYIDFGLDISLLEYDDLFLLPLLCRMMIHVGLENDDPTNRDVLFNQQINLHTGGISIVPYISYIHPNNNNNNNNAADEEGSSSSSSYYYSTLDGTHISSKIFIRGKCIASKLSDLLNIYSLILNGETTLDSKQIAINILREMLSDMEDKILTSGHTVAHQRMKSRYDILSYINEDMISGIGTIDKLVNTLHVAQTNFPLLLERLNKMKSSILFGHPRSGMIINLTGDKYILENIQDIISNFIDNQLPQQQQGQEDQQQQEEQPFIDFITDEHPWVPHVQEMMSSRPLIVNEGIIAQGTQVSYVGKCGLLYKPNDIIDGSVSVIKQYLSTGYMYDELRVKRGAYGALSVWDRNIGTFEFLSYRDPNPIDDTIINVYDKVDKYLQHQLSLVGADGEKIENDLSEAIISTIGSIDGSAPTPSDIGWMSLVRYLSNETPQMRQSYRKQILNTGRSNVEEFTARISSMGFPSLAIVTSQHLLDMSISNLKNANIQIDNVIIPKFTPTSTSTSIVAQEQGHEETIPSSAAEEETSTNTNDSFGGGEEEEQEEEDISDASLPPNEDNMPLPEESNNNSNDNNENDEDGTTETEDKPPQ